MRDRLFIITVLAASVALGMSAAPATAATVNQLPGQGRVVAGRASVGSLAGGSMSLDISGPTVINWGKGTARGDINAGGVAGFNIGSGAHVNFNGSAGAAVLNIDSSGRPSQIFGALTAHGTNVFVANGNGIIVGANARIVSDHMVGLIANQLLPGTAAGFDGSTGSVAYNGAGGDVTVLRGASFSGGGQVLVAGGGNVNVDLGAFAGPLSLRAGMVSKGAGAGASNNTHATLTVSGQQRAAVTGFSSAGAATNQGTLALAHASVAGTFTNNGTLSLANGFSIAGRLVNNRTVNARGTVTLGRLTNKGSLTTRGVLRVRGALRNDGSISSPTYRGEVRSTGTLTNTGTIAGVSYVGVSRGSLVNSGSIRLVDRADLAGTVGIVDIVGGNLTNTGSIASVADASGVARYSDLSLSVLNGEINNASGATLADFGAIATGSDATAANFHSGADYSITNAGTIAGSFSIDANASARQQGNSSTGSFTNTGVLDARATSSGDRSLWINAWNDINLGGKVVANGKALGSRNALDGLSLYASNGKLTVGTPLTFFADGRNSGAAYLSGRQVRIAASLVGLGADAGIYVMTGRKRDGSYAYSVAPGVRVSASNVYVSGQ